MSASKSEKLKDEGFKMDVLIENGMILDEAGAYEGNIGIVGERIVVGKPGATDASELILAGASPGGETVGKPEEQRRARLVGFNAVEVEIDTGASGEITSTITQAVDGAAVGRVMAMTPGNDVDSKCQVSREIIGPTTKDVTLLDQGGDNTGQRRLLDSNHSSKSWMNREAQHLLTEGSYRPVVRINGIQILEE